MNVQKVALVTGATSGIGQATAHRLHARGYLVYGAGRNPEALDALRARGLQARSLDVTDEDAVTRLVAEIDADHGAVDVLVNSAGIPERGVLEQKTPSEVRALFEMHVVVPLRLSQAVLPGMRTRGTGTIVNIGSIAGRVTGPAGGAYHIVKSGLEALSLGLRAEVAQFGVRVTLIEGKPRLLEFVDGEIVEALQYHLRQSGLALRLGERVATIRVLPAGDGGTVEVALESGKTVVADCLMYCAGREGATGDLNLAAVGLEADERGRLRVDANYVTAAPHVLAVGDVIGFPALASTSMEQGRVAVARFYGTPCDSMVELLPYGIYAIPEIATVGRSEEDLTRAGVPYETGVAQYREIARGQLLGDEIGMLKLLIRQDTHAVLGAHAIGTGATELIHVAQAVMALGGTADYFVDAVFNYPTLAECYRVAALNGLNKLRNA